jgi:hypothetical protein
MSTSHAWADEDTATPIHNGGRKYYSNKSSRRSAKPDKPRKVKGLPTTPKPCKVYRRTGGTLLPLVYDATKVLLSIFDGKETTFPSHREAGKAIWHTLEYYKVKNIKKADGMQYHDDDFVIEDV